MKLPAGTIHVESPEPSTETVPCPRCGTSARPITNGHGGVVLECPHCTLGWPRRPAPVVPRCVHGLALTVRCTQCDPAGRTPKTRARGPSSPAARQSMLRAWAERKAIMRGEVEP